MISKKLVLITITFEAVHDVIGNYISRNFLMKLSKLNIKFYILLISKSIYYVFIYYVL